MIKKVFLLAVISIAITCQAQHEVIVKGLVQNNTYSQVQLLQISPLKTLATASLSGDGRFNLNTNLTMADIYKLSFDNNQFIMLILGPGDSVYVEIDPSNFSYPKVSGTGDTKTLYAALTQLSAYDTELRNAQQEIETKKMKLMQDYITQNSSSLSTLFFTDKIDAATNSELLTGLQKSLEEKYPDNLYVADFKRRLKEQLVLGEGQIAPEINLPDTSGNNIALSSLRGKVVLIDFWAGWCGPCRRENPNVLKLYNEYKDKGFEIYGVSLDKNLNSWKAAIAQDGITWIQVSDLSAWSTQAIKDYNVTGIPFTVLIDKEGRILAKSLRGEQLEKKLEEIFK